MEWVETTGKTVADAIEAALDELGVDERDAEVVVVEDGRAGFLGFLRTDARVRARVRPSAPRPKRPQRSRRGRREGGGRDGAAARPMESSAARASAETATTEARAERPRSHGGRSGRAGGGKRRQGSEQPTRAASHEEEAVSIEEQSESVRAFVAGVVERFGLDASTSVRIEDDEIFVDVEGTDLGLLIGQRGATLESLQELTRTVVQRRSEEHAARVTLDVAGFRAKRAAALEQFTRRVAAQVLEQGTPQRLEPMSAADRKIVHDTVTSIEGVTTSSEGVDPRRYVVIRPADAEASAEPAADEPSVGTDED